MIEKSSRHSKIIGDFGEHYIANWLSRSGFEVILVDHTGIDIVAYNKKMNKRIGITVKSRTRTEGTETTFVTIFKDNKTDREKVLEACSAFACEPWISVYIETSNAADISLLSLDHYDKTYSPRPDSKSNTWKMELKNKQKYEEDNDIKHIRIQFDLKKWDWTC